METVAAQQGSSTAVQPASVNAEPGVSPSQRRACPLCGRNNADGPALSLSQEPWQLKRCTDCTMVYLENAPDYEALVADLAWEKSYTTLKETRRRGRGVRYAVSDAAKAFKRAIRGGKKRVREQRFLIKYIPPGNVLDVGCANGDCLHIFPEDYTPFGVEISRSLALIADDYCKPRGGRCVQASAIDGMTQFSAAHFTGMMMRAFLEHETNPRELLSKACRALATGGRIIIKVPNFASLNRKFTGTRWCGLRFPDHVNYFTPATLRRIVEDAGLAVHRFAWFDHFFLSDNMWLVAERPAPRPPEVISANE